MSARLSAQIAFLKEADKLKQVDRANLLLDLSRPENAAEHCWHLALYALVFAPLADADVSIARVIRMLLLHDLVEIEVGDHPIHEDHDWTAVAAAEERAAERLFGMLPADQAPQFLDLWRAFEAEACPDSRFAKQLDRCQPIFQVLCAQPPVPEHVEIVRHNLSTGRVAPLHHDFPQAYHHALMLLGEAVQQVTGDVAQRLRFLCEADRLKSVTRASRLLDNSRYENSPEHSWHAMLYAWVLADQAAPGVDIDRVLGMLLLHDIVEIDAGDAPIHGQSDQALMAAKEDAAAERLFGLLPPDQDRDFNRLWREFEAAETADAVFTKAIDRLHPPIANLKNGGGSWVEYSVTMEQLDQRVGVPLNKGAPNIWAWLRPQVRAAL
ncbi:HD domain-containing protein [Ruegeria sp. 2205SS24-7]|uniref:HD domain-containing protein n=1 Tax=Ruegeria discodermiae TaxID=3064389 RepID=UPI00274190AC|nr:HD domain-containing protein [Ruegeria sp. 2205SS24-7]MDP5216146.1 HD domain-containing protein [Ruegeria sp. 2205SS24-7]